MDDVSKDLVFAQPTEPVKNYGYADQSGRTRPRDWTVAEVEEVMWRIRASGGTDSTPVVFSGYKPEEAIKARHVEAFPVEVPRSLRQEEETAPPEPVKPPLTPRRLLVPAACGVGLAFLLPVLAWLLALVLRHTIGAMF
jgi:hypothetical protein